MRNRAGRLICAPALGDAYAALCEDCGAEPARRGSSAPQADPGQRGFRRAWGHDGLQLVSPKSGSTLGAAVLGTVPNASLARGHAETLQQIQQMLVGQGAAASAVMSRAGRAHGRPLTFRGILMIAGGTLAFSVFVPQATEGHGAPT
jgi:hypothetical protein